MYVCFKCLKRYSVPTELIRHFKYSHFLTSSDTLRCCQNNCSQLFSSFKSFKSHVMKVHVQISNNAGLLNNTINNVTSNEFHVQHQVASTDTTTFDLQSKEVIENQPQFNLQQSVTDLKGKALYFSLYLHASDNLTRKDVLTIQSQVTALCSAIEVVLKSALKALPHPDCKI